MLQTTLSRVLQVALSIKVQWNTLYLLSINKINVDFLQDNFMYIHFENNMSFSICIAYKIVRHGERLSFKGEV